MSDKMTDAPVQFFNIEMKEIEGDAIGVQYNLKTFENKAIYTLQTIISRKRFMVGKGRADKEKELYQTLKASSFVRLHGLSGQGKKTLALHIAEKWLQIYHDKTPTVVELEIPVGYSHVENILVHVLESLLLKKDINTCYGDTTKIQAAWNLEDLFVVINRSNDHRIYGEIVNIFGRENHNFHLLYVSETAPTAIVHNDDEITVLLDALSQEDAVDVLISNLNRSVKEKKALRGDASAYDVLAQMCHHVGNHPYSIEMIAFHINQKLKNNKIEAISLINIWKDIQRDITNISNNTQEHETVVDLIDFTITFAINNSGIDVRFKESVSDTIAFNVGLDRIYPEFLVHLYGQMTMEDFSVEIISGHLNALVDANLLTQESYSFHPLFYHYAVTMRKKDKNIASQVRSNIMKAWKSLVEQWKENHATQCKDSYREFSNTSINLLGLLRMLSKPSASHLQDGRSDRDVWFGLDLPENKLKNTKERFHEELSKILETAYNLSTMLRSLAEPKTCYPLLDRARIAYSAVKVTEAYLEAKSPISLRDIYNENQFVQDDHRPIYEALYLHLRRLGLSLRALDSVGDENNKDGERAWHFFEKARVIAHRLNVNDSFTDNLSGAYQNLADYYNRQEKPFESFRDYVTSEDLLKMVIAVEKDAIKLKAFNLRYLKLLVGVIQNIQDIHYFIKLSMDKVPSLDLIYRYRHQLGKNITSTSSFILYLSKLVSEVKGLETPALDRYRRILQVIAQAYTPIVTEAKDQDAISKAIKAVLDLQGQDRHELSQFIRFLDIQDTRKNDKDEDVKRETWRYLQDEVYYHNNQLRLDTITNPRAAREDLLYIYVEQASTDEQQKGNFSQTAAAERLLKDIAYLQTLPQRTSETFVNEKTIQVVIQGKDNPNAYLNKFIPALYQLVFALLRYEYYCTRWFAPIADIFTYSIHDENARSIIKNWFSEQDPLNLDDWKEKADKDYNKYLALADQLMRDLRHGAGKDFENELDQQDGMLDILRANHAVMHRDTVTARKIWQKLQREDPDDFLPSLSIGYVNVMEAQYTRDEAFWWEEAYSAYTKKYVPEEGEEMSYWEMIEEASDIASAADGFYDLFWYFVQRNDRTRAEEMLTTIVHFTVMLQKNQDSKFNQ
jgi:hypothetical protein